MSLTAFSNLPLSPFSAFRNRSPEGLRHKLSAVRTLCEPEQARATHDVPLYAKSALIPKNPFLYQS
ncbi:MAG: hypothetical protein KME25_14030 [Symplocastrum torsivum CPER-KK1]|uniref:Uncharacterized protein n=1 Tax=Symplocastrum torsivum CPER-KK1 TaxID=450513 RepID=A0A951UA73_9CYAN|nr:hypothetical protein [Symplocastrum torsivum CPER-KK1]